METNRCLYWQSCCLFQLLLSFFVRIALALPAMLSTLLPAATGPLPISPRRPRLFCRSAAPFRWIASSAAWIGRSVSPGAIATGASIAGTGSSFGWDDVFRIAAEGGDYPSDLRGYFDRVRACNRGAECRSEFLPFVIEDQVAGYIHNSDVHIIISGAEACVLMMKALGISIFCANTNTIIPNRLPLYSALLGKSNVYDGGCNFLLIFTDHLRRFTDVFVMLDSNKCYSDACVTLHSSLITPEDKTRAVGHVIKSLGSLIPGIRNELYPVTRYGMTAFFSLERAAAPFFGIKVYGVQMNGYVEKGGKKYLWIGKRSSSKPTFPGMLDQLVAGGLPHGISCKKNIIKECKEEAGIPEHIANRAVPVGAVSYMDIDGQSYKRDTLFCYDLKLPDDFVPENEGNFRLLPVDQVANIVRRTEFFKPNCCLVIIDFLFRHGFIGPDDSGYLELLQSLRSGDCSRDIHDQFQCQEGDKVLLRLGRNRSIEINS
ncbi:hypothetical protein Taro_029755 [Colocasia esculenta]|uniref:Nudix hydrolase domain-containing protein n=1 Tax=Colocasia esculenta TaxID=4460 RepID=A0A843VPY7_COLES|nr:hypothetical protein [Colocasia esculenta]